MKSAGEIRKKIDALKQKRLKKMQRPSPEKCVHNYEHKTADGSVRLCILGSEDPEEWLGNLCETKECARSCPFYKSRHTPQELEAQLEEQLQEEEVLYTEHRDIAMLLWVLGEERAERRTWVSRLKFW